MSPWYTVTAIFPKGGTTLLPDSLVPLAIVIVVPFVQFVTRKASHEGKCVLAFLNRTYCTFHNLVLFSSSLWFSKFPSQCLCCFIARIYGCFWRSICWRWLFNTGMTCFLHTEIVCFSDYPIICSFYSLILLRVSFNRFWFSGGFLLACRVPRADPDAFSTSAVFSFSTTWPLGCRSEDDL